ncbi:MAG: enoyl-CoA hydratase/isomerase family protein [Hyphomonadaceae bacterium]|nr:enoyl-CoA hydratase/isomerase family protein [Hyphomonadaceae bacterium]
MLQINRQGAVAIATLNNVRAHNTLTRDFWGAFREALATLESKGVRALVLTGAGRKAFCVGGDLHSFAELKSESDRRSYMMDCITTFQAMENSDLVIVSAVNGLALGGGCELAFASDIVVASETAEFGLPEARFGLMPGYAAFRGPTIIGRQWTKYLICTGERISAKKAQRLGLVLEITEQSAAAERACKLAEQIANAAPLAVRACKRMANGPMDNDTFASAIDLVTSLQGTADVAEGLAAFIEKRKPSFKGA